MASSTEWRIVLVGKTGAGKSACGNTILKNPKAFESKACPASVTKKCQKETAVVDGLTVSVVDTPGIYDTDMEDDDLRSVVGSCIELSLPGPHAFLLVIRLDMRFTNEESKVIKWIKDNFGDGALDYTIVLFTRADQIGEISVEDYIKKSIIVSVVQWCGGRYHAFKKSADDTKEVDKLLKTVKEMNEKKRGKYYSIEAYKTAQKRLKKKMVREDMIDGALTAMTAVGVGTAMVGGAMMAIVETPVAIAAIAGGAAVAAGAGAGSMGRAINKMKNKLKKK